MSKVQVTSGKHLSHFNCSKCKVQVVIGVYVIAQTAMGHKLTHTCKCGQRHTIKLVKQQGYEVESLKG